MALGIAIIIVLGLMGDRIFTRLKLPGLVGMLLVGILCGPYGLKILPDEILSASSDLRKLALVVILLRAGFELRRDTLKRVGRAAVTMSAVPAIFEIIGIVIFAPLLFHISYVEAAILGAILGAVSPAVVVPIMIDFMQRGKGSKKGIPTLILGASSIDDVFVIVLYSIFLGMYGGESVNYIYKLLEIPLSISLGIISGIIPGIILLWVFKKYDFKPPRRTLIVLGSAIVLTTLEKELEPLVPVASLLGVMTIGFIILDKAEAIAHIISKELKKVWVFGELVLFILIGAQVNIPVAIRAGFMGALLIFIGLVFRSIGTYIALFGTDLNFKEKVFCVISYIPKATVQAAIGAGPLAYGVASGELILALAVLSILLTAPVGAILTSIFGERILEKVEQPEYSFKELREALGLPHVGERVKSKRYNTLWKVIEQKETWIEENGTFIPAIYLRYWKPDTANGPKTGKTLYYRYSIKDPSFNDHWEIVYDWG